MINYRDIFVVAPCMLVVLSPLFVQLMHTNYCKIVEQLKSFKIIIVAPTCFGLHKSSSGSSQPVLRFSFNTLTCSCAFTNHPVYSGSHSVLVRLPITWYIADHIQFLCAYQSPGIFLITFSSRAFTNHPVYSGSHSVLVRLPITRYIAHHIQFLCVYQSPGT